MHIFITQSIFGHIIKKRYLSNKRKNSKCAREYRRTQDKECVSRRTGSEYPFTGDGEKTVAAEYPPRKSIPKVL